MERAARGRVEAVLGPDLYTIGAAPIQLRANSCLSHRVPRSSRGAGKKVQDAERSLWLYCLFPHSTSGGSMASPGMDQQRLAELQNVIRADIKAGLYHGAVIKVARAGAVALADGHRRRRRGADQAAGAELGVQHLFNHQGVHQHAGAAGNRAGTVRADFDRSGADPGVQRSRAREGADLALAVPPGGLSHHLRGQARHVHRSVRGDDRRGHRSGATRGTPLRHGGLCAAGESRADGGVRASLRSEEARLPANRAG